jgi:hypothetical protein
MKQCKNCKTIHTDRDTKFIFCAVCGCAEWEVIGNELPFDNNESTVKVKGMFHFDIKPEIVNIKVNPFPKNEKDFADIARAIHIASLLSGKG